MEYVLLSEVASYSKLRTRKIDLNSYVSTENMLPNKKGVILASSIPSVSSASKYEVGDILLSNIRPYFCKIWQADKTGSCSNDVLIVKANDSIDSKFLYYVLSDQNFFNYDTTTSKGTKMPRGNKRAIMKYLVPYVPLDNQRLIASILSTYDTLIENNSARIRLLEKMAENLYKEWFVRFRFPGHENAEMEKGLPKGWMYYRIEELCDINRETIKAANAPKDILYLDTGSITRGEISDVETIAFVDAPSRARRMVRNNSIIYSTVRPNLQHYGILKNPPSNLLVSTGFAVLDCKEDIANIVYLALSHPSVYKYCSLIADCAVATYPSIKPKEIGKICIALPKISICKKWNEKIERYYKMIDSLRQQNSLLARQRDLLLPRLMSGKLEVKIKK